MNTYEDMLFWAGCLEQALDEMDGTGLILERANEIYENGDVEH